MKNAKVIILACLVLATPLLFVSATWEGVADIATGRNPHGETYAIATNAFPRNMVVDVTNLENNRGVRVLVVSGQSNAGVLGTLSPGAASSIGMNGNSVSRVRISQPSDDIAFAHIRRGPLPDLDETAADFEPAETAGNPSSEEGYADVAEIAEYESEYTDVVAFADEDLAETEEESVLVTYEEAPFLPEDEVLAVAEYPTEELVAEPISEPIPQVAEIHPNGIIAGARAETEYEPARPEPTVMHEPRIYIPDFRFTLMPTEERLPPAVEHVIAEEHIIPPIEPGKRLAPVEVATPVPPPAEPVFVDPIPWVDPRPRNVPSFHAVSNLERNMWYVQLGAFRYACSVEEEISRIGTVHPYPLLIQNIGTEADPMFRVLLGPLNQGESAAVLRRIRSIGDTQAFARQAR